MDAVGLSVGRQRWTTCGEISAVQASIRGTYPENRTPLSRAGTPRAFSGCCRIPATGSRVDSAGWCCFGPGLGERTTADQIAACL
jgi:hypothetical protein